jgi:hypothetical protein
VGREVRVDREGKASISSCQGGASVCTATETASRIPDRIKSCQHKFEHVGSPGVCSSGWLSERMTSSCQALYSHTHTSRDGSSHPPPPTACLLTCLRLSSANCGEPLCLKSLGCSTDMSFS